MGRERVGAVAKGPRVIDLDLLLYFRREGFKKDGLNLDEVERDATSRGRVDQDPGDVVMETEESGVAAPGDADAEVRAGATGGDCAGDEAFSLRADSAGDAGTSVSPLTLGAYLYRTYKIRPWMHSTCRGMLRVLSCLWMVGMGEGLSLFWIARLLNQGLAKDCVDTFVLGA